MCGKRRKVFLFIFVLSAVYIGLFPLSVSAVEVDEAVYEEIQTENQVDVSQDEPLSTDGIVEGSSENPMIPDDTGRAADSDQVVSVTIVKYTPYT